MHNISFHDDSILDRLKLKLREDLMSSTFHGLSKIFLSNNRLRKLKWLILVIASYSYCGLSISSNIAHYYEYNTITEFREIYDAHPPFPEITIVAAYAINITCRFNVANCMHLIKISSETFEFNTGLSVDGADVGIFHSKETGEYSGLKLKITALNTTSDSYLGNNDIQIYINNQSVEHSNLFVSVSPGMRTNLAIRRVFEKHLSSPFSNCRRHVVLSDKNSRRQVEYRQGECFIFCRYQKYMENCGESVAFDLNSDFFYTDAIKFREFFLMMIDLCRNGTHDYISEVEKKFEESGENQICEKECPISCEVDKYSITPYYFRLSNENYTNGYTEVNIYHETFYYTLLVQQPQVSAYQLFGNVGGLFGKDL